MDKSKDSLNVALNTCDRVEEEGMSFSYIAEILSTFIVRWYLTVYSASIWHNNTRKNS